MDIDQSDVLRVEGTGAIRTVVLNRPEHMNAVNAELHSALADIWQHLLEDPTIRVVVLTGAGRAFSAGGDMDFLRRTADDSAWRHQTMREARRIVTEMMAFPLPVIAAVNGPAVGLGCSVALLSDVVLISEQAFFSDPHVSIGLVAADGGALCWPLLTSLLRAKEYLLTGDRIDAATACQLGFANRVIAPESLLTEANTLAERLAAQPQQAIRDTKRALNLHLQHAVANVIDFAFSAESETFASPEFRERLDAFQA